MQLCLEMESAGSSSNPSSLTNSSQTSLEIITSSSSPKIFCNGQSSSASSYPTFHYPNNGTTSQISQFQVKRFDKTYIIFSIWVLLISFARDQFQFVLYNYILLPQLGGDNQLSIICFCFSLSLSLENFFVSSWCPFEPLKCVFLGILLEAYLFPRLCNSYFVTSVEDKECIK